MGQRKDVIWNKPRLLRDNVKRVAICAKLRLTLHSQPIETSVFHGSHTGSAVIHPERFEESLTGVRETEHKIYSKRMLFSNR